MLYPPSMRLVQLLRLTNAPLLNITLKCSFTREASQNEVDGMQAAHSRKQMSSA